MAYRTRERRGLLGAGAALLACIIQLGGCGSGKSGNGTVASGGTSSGSGGTSGSGGVAGAPLDGGIQIDGASGDAKNPCHRDVNLTAVKLGEPQPFDLVIVADHSQSLSWSRDELTAGLRNLLTNVKGRSVRVFLYTPTQYGASSAGAREPISGKSVVVWQDPRTGRPYTNAMTTYSESCTDLAGASIPCPGATDQTPHNKEGIWSFKTSNPIATLSPQMTDAEFAAQQRSVADAIVSIAGTGSPQEQPLCTLSRYVSQDPGSIPANVVFLIISDEDDVSTPAECLAGFSGRSSVNRLVKSTPCSSNCDTYRHSMRGDTTAKLLAVRCAAFDDLGNPIPGTETSTSGSQITLGPCSAGPCTAEESQFVSSACELGKRVTGCERTCIPSAIFCTLKIDDPTIDACSEAFTVGGTRYQNMAAYCVAQGTGSGWRQCSREGENIDYEEYVSGSHIPRPLMTGSTTADIGRYFRSRADTAFAGGSYLVQAIVFDPAFSCTLGAGQSHATNLAAVVADRNRLFSFCGSYAPALEGVSTFAQTLIQTEFSLPLKDDENITSVTIIGTDASERALANGQFRYERATQTLVVERSSLRVTDASLRVEVTSNCRPIPA